MPDKIEWAAPEYNQYKKSQSWFFTVGLLFIILLLWAVWTKNILFAILIGLSYFLIIVFGLKKPNIAYISIKPKGISINTKFYDYDSLKSFWIFYEPPQLKEISLRSKKKTSPYIKIPLGEQNPVEIRSLLIKHIPERKHKESLLDNLSRDLRF